MDTANSQNPDLYDRHNEQFVLFGDALPTPCSSR